MAMLFLLAAASCAGAVTPDPLEPADLPDAAADAPGDASADAGGLVIGRPCADDADCGDEYRCQTTVPGGYCVLTCASDVPCPEGSVCSPLPLSRVTGVCMKACSATTECRAGYVCDVVSLFPGDPSAPSSPSPVCWEPQSKDGGP
jgi:hypothetical protein